MELWDEWEQQVIARGKPERCAQELSDEELVNLLAAAPEREATARVLKQEALMRLHRAPRADRGSVREPAATGMFRFVVPSGRKE